MCFSAASTNKNIHEAIANNHNTDIIIKGMTQELVTIKASANKNAILVFAFQTPQHFTHFG